MKSSFRTAPLLLAMIVALAGCSDESAGSDSGASPADTTDVALDTVDATADVGPDPSFVVGDPCVASDQCGAGFCDKRKGGCVECYLTAHCPDGSSCWNGACVEDAECSDEAPCASGVCDEGACVECATDTDCQGTFTCVSGVCRPRYGACTQASDCESGAICIPSAQTCGDCLDDSQCAAGETCADRQCRPRPCQPGAPECEGDSVRICRADGTGYQVVPCQGAKTCLAGVCVEATCTPGEVECVKYQQKLCTDTGQVVIKNCPPGQECREGECRDMKQRVLVVFDTSGSMNLFPGTNSYPKLCGGDTDVDCLDPWPGCEPGTAPMTTMGISKRVFSQFFSSDDTEDVIFALQRFPQSAKRATPVCEGGYYEGDVVMSGDINEEHELPVGANTWFDDALAEVLLVPFPKPGSTSNLLPLLQWMDFKETLLKTGSTCVVPEDCDGGVCLGPAGNRRCHTFTNPELRAHGWTPLGKSLFYAGEYIRRYVVVDGKACAKDEDCGSPGYFCSEAGKCFDPLKECRLNVVVLFTDGAETEYPSTNDFFNPQVQAKRLRYGLGCTTDDECSKLTFCRPKKEKPSETECFQPRCGDDGYCTNDAIVNDPQAQKVSYVDDSLYDANRLRDANGNPIDVIVNVVDASGADKTLVDDVTNANRLVALYGGGVHVVVSAGDEADFLASLKKTIDFKSLFSQCAISPGGPATP